MTYPSLRTPLRPLSRILPARERGENTDVIERENIRARHAHPWMSSGRADVPMMSREVVFGEVLNQVIACFFG